MPGFAFHDLQFPFACGLAPGSQLLPAISAIRSNLLQTGPEKREPCEQTTGSPGLVVVGRGHRDGNGDAQRIHEKVSFPACNRFMGIRAADPRGFLDRSHPLGIPDGSTWVRVSSLPFALGPMKGPPQKRPGALEAQAPKRVKHGLPWWKVGWQVRPRAVCSQDGEDSIENGTQGVGWRPATFGLRRQIAWQALPFCIRKIAGVTGTHSPSLSCGVISAISKTRSEGEISW